MPQMYRAKDSVTGESVAFQWKGPKNPTQEDIGGIFKQRRQAKSEIAEQQKTPFMEDVMRVTKPVVDVARKVTGVWPGTEYEGPVKELSEAIESRSPRRILHGALGVAAPPAIAAGMLTAPIPTAAAVGTMMGAQPLLERGYKAAVEPLPPESTVGRVLQHPEALLIPDIASFALGGVAGVGARGLGRRFGPTPAAPPPTVAPIPTPVVPRATPQLPSPEVIPPVRQLPAPTPQPVTPEGALMMPPPPIRMPPAGTAEAMPRPLALPPPTGVRPLPVRSMLEQPVAPPVVEPPVAPPIATPPVTPKAVPLDIAQIVKAATEVKAPVVPPVKEAVAPRAPIAAPKVEAPEVKAPLDPAEVAQAALTGRRAKRLQAAEAIEKVRVAPPGVKAPEVKAPPTPVVPSELPFKIGDVVKSPAGSYKVTATGPKMVTYDFTNKAGHLNKNVSMGNESFSVLARKSKETKPKIGEVKKSEVELKLKDKIEQAEKDYEAALDEGNMRGADRIEREILSMRKRLRSYKPGERVDMGPEAGVVPGEVLTDILKVFGRAAAYRPPREISLGRKGPKRPMGVEAPGAKVKAPTTKAPTTPVEKVVQAIQEARPLRGEQETLYARERAIRVAQASRAEKGLTGEARVRAVKAELAGELPKRQFEAIKSKLGQKDVDDLYGQAWDTPGFDFFDRIHVSDGLNKLLDGTVPQKSELALLERSFGPKFVRTVSERRPLWEKMKEGGMQLANMPRSFMASFDLSAPFRQGLFFVRRPQFWASLKPMVKSFGSEKFYNELQTSISRRPLYELGKESKLSLTELGKGLLEREERFMSGWAEQVPVAGRGVRASSRAYVGFLNKLRSDVFDDLVYKAERLGKKPQKNRDLTRGIAEYINTATGRGSLGRFEKSAVELNTFFFSPRLVTSRLKLLGGRYSPINPNFYIKLDPFVRKEVMKDVLTLSSAALTVLGLAKMAGADVEADPRNPDFGKIKIGDTRVDIGGGFQQYIRLGAQLLASQTVSSTTGKVTELGAKGFRVPTRTDVITRATEYKLSPIASFGWGLIRGKTPFGEEFKVGKEIGQRFVPMVAGDLYDIAKSDPKLLPLSALGVVGFGLQTYESKAKRKGGIKRLKGLKKMKVLAP